MQNQRMKVFHFPHRAIRNALAELVLESGRIESPASEEWKELKGKALEIFRILEAHARDEEKFTLRHLEDRLSGSTEQDRREHVDLENRLDALAKILQRENADISDTAEFCDSLIDFQSRYFSHMRREETETQELIWKQFTDSELEAHHLEIMKALEPEEMKLWSKYLLPTLPPKQRAAFEEKARSVSV
ncbi:cation-binding protein [Leptospira wolffii]|uniref:hemerythrin domain-containing protein n=2 Tax=Leptospira wolffii TaxID=409998 RepID=UPI00108409EF|nr:hemerythrin domain-containing protein [Leptospira wolffii]TGK62353.1 cation-binding protein [Leptospira wolffii]TGK68130.1 cation-binding protein [Leptospira wolffii]TGK74263.1 cation-binding protein [Leptospira wolffii]